MPGPQKIPPRLKLLRGTAHVADRVAALESTPPLPALDAVPTPPHWLKNLNARAEWDRLAPVLTANRLLHAGNIGLLAQLCAVHGHLVDIWTNGLKANAALVATYRMLSNSLGLLNWDVPTAKPGNRFTRNILRAKQHARGR